MNPPDASWELILPWAATSLKRMILGDMLGEPSRMQKLREAAGVAALSEVQGPTPKL